MSFKTLKYSAATLAVAASLVFAAVPVQAAALTDTQISAIISLLSSFGANATVIANVTTSLQGGTPPPSGGGQMGGDDHHMGTSTDSGRPKPPPPMWTGSSTPPLSLCPQLKHDFMMGASDSKNEGEVSKVQKFLKDSGAYTGPVTGYFGMKTEGALEKWSLMASTTVMASTTMPGRPSPRALFARFCAGSNQMMGSSTPSH